MIADRDDFDLDDLDEFLSELVAAGLVEIFIGPDGEIRYRRAPGLSDFEWFTAGIWLGRSEDLDG